ncbi:RNA polymerase sigma factor SigW [Sporolactobacillus spathodeae]|uniref:RNA polymerase sigma factor SigW n=1 Tax=Sporolactobacillus spathodeae TaxID=1465502 RepID=A0ABS2QBD3_9BACL|nr:RNA polymerase sigma factor SigW [Sporolactobacillus spathodeae]MBM7659119.1 RNA polymerase sigma-70 factor (ECF subfamily) [Sporolactobacillus spathodeae]
MEAKEKRLIKKIKKGDHQAFAEMVDKYKNKVYVICFRMVGNKQEAEDLSQETFLRAYRYIGQYDMERKFSTWLFRIATNLSIDALRRRKPGVSLDAELPGTEGLALEAILPDNQASPDEKMVQNELETAVQKEIQRLPEKYRTAIVLKYLEDLSLKEISEIMDIPVATVKTRIHRGREQLRKYLIVLRGEKE